MENDASVSELVEAATEIIWEEGYAAGYWGEISELAPLLPAAQIKSAEEESITSFNACDSPGPLNEHEIIGIPFWVAYNIADIASDVYPLPFESRNFKGMIFRFQPTPAVPIPLFPIAARVPAQCVP